MRITPANELRHIIKILESCENELHLGSVQNMFKNFRNKWENKVDSTQMIEYMYDFSHKLEIKRSKL
jgi:hypothetical protein